MSKKNLINRELSLLQFQHRVLGEAENTDNPLLERGRFISICSSNLDEFFMVRVGSLYRALEINSEKTDPTGLTAGEQLSLIFPAVRKLVNRQYDLLQEEYLPLLEGAGIFFLRPDQLTGEQKEWLSRYFDSEVLPLLTPRAVDDRRPFPLLRAKCLHLALLLPPAERGGAPRMALVPVPKALPRVTMLPMGVGKVRGILLEDVMTMFASRLFNGVSPVAAFPFRITRNTDFGYKDDDADALIVEMRKNLKQRKWGKVVRLEVPAQADNRLLSRLKRYLDVENEGIFLLNGPVGLEYFSKQISSLPGFDDLRYTEFTPRIDPQIAEGGTVFDAIRKGDILLHHPYDSFDPVVRFVCEAADDPNVLAIKQTLYRVSGKSPIVAALSHAAQQGKQVTVLIEVRARFDEENNINWCLALEKAGCHVFYGVPKYKTHSKITLVVRKEEDGLRRYVHLATGNYNDVTAKQYTDFGLLTCDDAIGRDAGIFFNGITGYDDDMPMEKLISAPNRMRKEIKELIKREKKNAMDGRPAAITAKMNSLVDPKVIKWLLKAAEEGVEVNLIVRGICCLKPEQYEEHLHIRSIVGRFLEHCRAFVFENGGEPEVYLSSADWMPRNLDKRVELMFPVEDPALKQRVISTLQDELKDNRKAWSMKKSGRYQRVRRDEPAFNCQETRILGPAVLSDDNDDFYQPMEIPAQTQNAEPDTEILLQVPVQPESPQLLPEEETQPVIEQPKEHASRPRKMHSDIQSFFESLRALRSAEKKKANETEQAERHIAPEPLDKDEIADDDGEEETPAAVIGEHDEIAKGNDDNVDDDDEEKPDDDDEEEMIEDEDEMIENEEEDDEEKEEDDENEIGPEEEAPAAPDAVLPEPPVECEPEKEQAPQAEQPVKEPAMPLPEQVGRERRSIFSQRALRFPKPDFQEASQPTNAHSASENSDQ